uniref:pH regulation protein F n=1 Tax=Ignisphaera aggregans TaxID=334771 RepID=A0A7C2VM61_9CREN
MIETIMWILMVVSVIVYTVSAVLFSVVVFRGPTVGDQVLAIDAITYVTLVLIVLFSILFKEPILMVVAIPLALWVYALDIYVSKYLEKGDLGA